MFNFNFDSFWQAQIDKLIKMCDWSLLPSDILVGITLKLDLIEEVIYFSAVCHSWNHVCSSMVKTEWSRADKPNPPWLLLAEPNLEQGNDGKSNCRKVFSITKNKCYDMVLPEITEKRCWGSSYGWIVMHDFNKNVKLFNPITKAQLSLPSLYDLPTYSDDYFPGEEYGSSDDEDGSSDDEDGSTDEDYDLVGIEKYPWAMKVLVRRFIVLNIPGSNSIDELVVFAIHFPIDSIAFARPGDKAWTQVVEPWPQNRARPFIHQAMVWDGKVIILYGTINQSHDAAIAYCDIASIAANSNPVKAKDYVTIPYHMCRAAPSDLFFMDGEIYMVELAGDLLIVLRQRESGISNDYQDGQSEFIYLWENKHCYRTIDFKVHKLVCDPTSLSWENVEDLGNYMLFVGDNYATAVHISKAPNCQKNVIYFIDDESRTYWSASCGTEVRGHDMGMFDMASGKITSFYDGGDTISNYFSPIWFKPNF